MISIEQKILQQIHIWVCMKEGMKEVMKPPFKMQCQKASFFSSRCARTVLNPWEYLWGVAGSKETAWCLGWPVWKEVSRSF